MARRRRSPEGDLVALVLLLGGVVFVGSFRWWWRRIVCPIFWFHQRAVRPRHRHLAPDTLVERLAVARSVAGLALLATVEVVWRDADLAASDDIVGDWIETAYQNAFWLVGLFVVVSAGLLAAARRGHRGALLASLRAPAGTVALVVGSFAATLGTERLLTLGGGSAGAEDSGLVAVAFLAGYLAMAAVVIPWLLVTFFYTVPQLVAHYCRAVDAHPTMRALLALGLAVVLVIVATARWLDGTGADLPLAVRICVSYGGPALVAWLAVWELRRLDARGVTVRTPVAV